MPLMMAVFVAAAVPSWLRKILFAAIVGGISVERLVRTASKLDSSLSAMYSDWALSAATDGLFSYARILLTITVTSAADRTGSRPMNISGRLSPPATATYWLSLGTSPIEEVRMSVAGT